MGRTDKDSVERCKIFGVGSNLGSIKHFIGGAPPGSSWEWEAYNAFQVAPDCSETGWPRGGGFLFSLGFHMPRGTGG